MVERGPQKAALDARWAAYRADFAQRFWTWVDSSGGEDACWPWLGKTLKRGYGRYRLDGKFHFAHRAALRFAKGEPPAPDLLALHSCNNPPCCNPAHLRWGTSQANMDDRAASGRDHSHSRKIDPDELMRLRVAGGTYSQLAAHFGVNQTSIGKAIKREEKRALLRGKSAQEGAV